LKQNPNEAAEPRFRELCVRCRRAKAACWCDAVNPIAQGVKVVVLQHPREARNPIGTARMAHRALPGSTLLEGVSFEHDARLDALLSDPSRRVAILYPAAEARDITELTSDGDDRPITLFAIDGTWSQAKSVWNKNPRLRAIPAVRLSPSSPSRYRIRKEPAEHCLSTIEAIGEALRLLGGGGAGFEREAFLRPFDAMVEHQLSFIDNPRAGTRTRRHALRTKKPRSPLAPPELSVFGRNLVLVHGEANGWPASRSDGPAASLTQWLAVRPSTGETFHTFVEPATPMAPLGLERLEVDEATLHTAIPREEFLARWRAFSEPQDVLLTWAFFPLRLLREAGATLGPFVNLQTLGSEFFKKRLGKVENAYETLFAEASPSDADFPGRGGLRLAMLLKIAARLRGDDAPPAA